MATLETPAKLRELQRALYQRAKKEPKFRFYALYDKVYRPDVLAHAYALAKASGEPLLFKRDDFSHTDVARALP